MLQKNIILFIILLFSFFSISYAQIEDSVKILDNEKIFINYGDKYFPNMLSDFDNPEYTWLSVIKRLTLDDDGKSYLYSIYRVDDNLNILDSINSFALDLSIKYNNKLYGLNQLSFRYLGFNLGNYIDTIVFESRDMNGDVIIKKIISTYDKDSIHSRLLEPNVFFTKDKNFAFFRNDYSQDTIMQSNILIIDTLGNIIQSKTFRQESNLSFSALSENNNYFELLIRNLYTARTKLISLDKNTLDIVDSINDFQSEFHVSNFRFINDSIFVIIQNDYKDYDDFSTLDVKIVNKNNREIRTINFPISLHNSLDRNCNFPGFSNKIDYTNLDSIYFVTRYSTIVNIYPENSIIKLVNFNINGSLNYEYDFNFDTIELKQVNNIKATRDGGLIIACKQLYNDVSYFIKFMPNGFVGLTNTETGENESIKVYPNPAKDYINIDIEADSFKSSDVELFDMQGRLVKKSKLNAQIGNRIDVSTLSSGAYTYRVVINGKGISGKVVIGE